MPPGKRQRQRYKNRPRYNSTRANAFAPTRSTPYNQMSNYLRRNNPLPAVEYATFRYVQTVTIAPAGAGQAGYHTFRANSIYDPDRTGLTDGGQPYGHDTYQGIYNHYKVMSSTISVQALPSSSSDFAGFGINVDDDDAFQTDPRWLMASKGSTYTLGSQQSSHQVLSRSYNCNMLPDQSLLCTQFGTNPDQAFNFRVFTITSSTARDIECVVTINYRVQMWGLKELSIV